MHPTTFALPDLSVLEPDLLASHTLTMTLKELFEDGDTQFLVTTFIRTTDATVRCYESARTRLVVAGEKDSLVGFLAGCSDLEVAVMALNRAMRLAKALLRSKATAIDGTAVPSTSDQKRLIAMRDAIEHNVDPIVDGKAGQGLALALEVTDADFSIDRRGRLVTVTQVEFGEWTRDLHGLAEKLATDPGSLKVAQLSS